MPATSRERVLTTFNHREPDRVPLWVGSSVEFWEKAKRELNLDDKGLRVRLGDDFRRVFARSLAPATARTVFGIERKGLGYGQPVNHPLADATLADVEAYPWPDPAGNDVSYIREEALAFQGEYAILGGDWSPFWHDAIDLFGMEELYYRMYDAPEVVDAALQRMVDYYAESSRRIFDAADGAIDIFFIGNDLGSQTGPLLGVDLFRRFILPHLRRLIDLGHDYGMKVMMHCCGGFAPLIPSLIEAELDALHAVQSTCCGMDLAVLKKEFGDRMVFNGAIDSHHILINGTPDYVREQTRAVLDIMMPGGGYIAGASHDSVLEETPVENILAMCDTIQEYGCYH
ncbi:MAG: uroporphyrinogen decarboxylase family protein [Armatimonadota bacterium]